jgi:nitrogen fixation NifU-like protein
MPNLGELYQNVILEHNRSPRNYRAMPDADRQAEGNNPLCGDQVTVFVRMDGDIIDDVSFQGAGCAISRASASEFPIRVKCASLAWHTLRSALQGGQPQSHAEPGAPTDTNHLKE